MTRISTLPNFPIKACCCIAEDSSLIERQDLEGNQRMIMPIMPQGRFLTQRDHRRLVLAHSKELLKILEGYRKQSGGVMLAQNVIPLKVGQLDSGMEIETLS